MRTLRFLLSIQWWIQTVRKGGGGVGGGHPDPEIRGVRSIFFGLQASFWSKNKGGGGRAPRAPPLDPPPVLVTKLPHPRSNTKILDIALARGLRTKIKKPY